MKTLIILMLISVTPCFSQISRTSLYISPSSSGPIAFSDSAYREDAGSVTTYSWTHTIAGNYLVVAFTHSNPSDSAKVGTTKMTLLVGTNSPGRNISIYGLADPPIGAQTISVYYPDAVSSIAWSASYSNANLAGDTIMAYGSGTDVSDDIHDVVAGDIILMFAANGDLATFTGSTSGFIKRGENYDSDFNYLLYGEIPGTTGTVTVAGTYSGATDWVMAAVVLKQ